MALMHVSLGAPRFISVAPTAMLINPVDYKTFIREIVLHNTGTTIETVRLYDVPPVAGALGTPNLELRQLNISVPVNDTVHIPFQDCITLDVPNYAIFAECTTANKINIKFNGDKEYIGA